MRRGERDEEGGEVGVEVGVEERYSGEVVRGGARGEEGSGEGSCGVRSCSGVVS